jgi:hypothetical protein
VATEVASAAVSKDLNGVKMPLAMAIKFHQAMYFASIISKKCKYTSRNME